MYLMLANEYDKRKQIRKGKDNKIYKKEINSQIAMELTKLELRFVS